MDMWQAGPGLDEPAVPFDPARLTRQAEAFVAATLGWRDPSPGSGEHPAATIRAAALQAFQVRQAGETLLTQPAIQRLTRELDLLTPLLEITALVVTASVAQVYQRRASAAPAGAQAGADGHAPLPPWVKRPTERIRRELTDLFAARPAEADEAHAYLWDHLLTSAVADLDREATPPPAETSTDARVAGAIRRRLAQPQGAEEVGALLYTYAQSLARRYLDALDADRQALPALRQFLGLDDGPGTAPPASSPLLRAGHLTVMNSLPYEALREALYKNLFQQVAETPWPTAALEKGSARGHAQLRPVALDAQPLLPPDELAAWTALMWRQRGELSDLDADALDALSALWLRQARRATDDAVADVDDLLALRGLKPKRGGQGRRGGYEPEQRAAMLKAVSHIQNLWLNMAEMEVYEATGAGRRGRRPVKHTIQSRPFVITDRLGQLRMDGYMDVQKFVFRPGKVFAHFLMGPGRQTALLSVKALQYDPHNQLWEKRLTRYLSYQWRVRAQGGEYTQPYRVATLLEAAGEALYGPKPSRTRERLEQALDALQRDGVIAAWQYDQWAEAAASGRGWAAAWLQATILIEPPDVIRTTYRQLEQYEAVTGARTTPADGWGERMARQRRGLGLSQLAAAEQIGITQGYLNKLERSSARPSPALQRRLRAWLGDEAPADSQE